MMSTDNYIDKERMQSIGVGIIGAGHIAKSHAKVWSREDKLVAVCSRQLHKAEDLASSYGIPVICTTAQQLINRDDIGIVCIATPHDLHYPLAMSALKAGKHVFCEKPLALNVAEAREMCELSRQMGVKTGVQFAERTNWPSLMRLRELILEGELGEIQYFEGAWAFDWAQSPTHPMSWRFRKSSAGSGALGDLGAYMIDAARWLVGEITDVFADLVTL
ncbi:MAG: Gfo/Idh/MocA family oxidoreductase, partial [Candidatus Latescibacteria bacterium]|nr:Gfo/Idh/MocA family oxidoreductase [Candidatus Latescibacterota bacterium]